MSTKKKSAEQDALYEDEPVYDRDNPRVSMVRTDGSQFTLEEQDAAFASALANDERIAAEAEAHTKATEDAALAAAEVAANTTAALSEADHLAAAEAARLSEEADAILAANESHDPLAI